MKNEPAFPAPAGVSHITEQGMTLRDYFAAKAMQGFLAYAATVGTYAPPDDELAQQAYQMADAMLKERNK